MRCGSRFFFGRCGHSPLLPKLRFKDPEGRGLVYDYVPGMTHTGRGQKREWMKALAEGLFKLYGKAEDGIFGFADAPCSFWMEFNRRSHAYAFEMLEEHLPAEHHATIGRLYAGMAGMAGLAAGRSRPIKKPEPMAPAPASALWDNDRCP